MASWKTGKLLLNVRAAVVKPKIRKQHMYEVAKCKSSGSSCFNQFIFLSCFLG